MEKYSVTAQKRLDGRLVSGAASRLVGAYHKRVRRVRLASWTKSEEWDYTVHILVHSLILHVTAACTCMATTITEYDASHLCGTYSITCTGRHTCVLCIRIWLLQAYLLPVGSHRDRESTLFHFHVHCVYIIIIRSSVSSPLPNCFVPWCIINLPV